MDKSLRKNGAGAHNWGSVKDEVDAEFYDEVEGEAPVEAADKLKDLANAQASGVSGRRMSSVSTSSSTSAHNVNLEEARNFRAHAMKDANSKFAHLTTLPTRY